MVLHFLGDLNEMISGNALSASCNQNTSSGDGTATVVRGKFYTVTATIKGFGNDDPYNPITNAAMDVTIVSPSWTPVAINETFN